MAINYWMVNLLRHGEVKVTGFSILANIDWNKLNFIDC